MAVDVGSAVGYLDLDISGFLNNLKSAQSEAEKGSKNLASKMGEGLTSAGQKMSAVGGALTKTVTAPIVGLGTLAVKTTANFESSMSKVSAISGATGKDFDKLKEKAKEMGAKTKFSASESADAFQYMAMAGWKTNDMLDGIDGVMSLAAADGLDLATTSDIVTDGLTAFGLSAKDAGRFADVLAQTGRNANTNVSMLGESFKYVAPVAGALGYSVEDTSVALGLMANSGIKASSAGTALRSMLTNLAKPSKETATAMEYLGISLENEEGGMKSLSEVMKDLRESFGECKMPMDQFKKQMAEIQTKFENGELTEKKYNKAVEDLTEKAYGAEGALKAKYAAAIAGKTGMAGLLAIVNTGEDDFNKLTNAVNNSTGAAKEMSDTMLNNLNGQITILKSALEGLAIQFGEILMPYVKKFVAKLQELVEKFQALTPEQKEQVVKWAAIAAAVGPVILGLGKFTSALGSVFTFFSKAPAAFGVIKGAFVGLKGAIMGISAPVVAIVAVIATLVAAFVHLWKTNERFRKKITSIWNGIKAKFEAFGKGIVDRLNKLGFDFKDFTEVVKAVWEGFCKLLAPIFEGVFEQIGNIIGAALDVITGIFDVFSGLFTGDWELMWDGVKEIFQGVWDFIGNSAKTFGEMLKGIFDVILGWFGTSWDKLWGDVKQFFVDTWTAITTFFTNTVNGIKTGVSNFINAVINFFKQLPTNIANFITQAYNSVKTWVINMVKAAGEVGKNFVDAVIGFFKDLPYNVGKFIGMVLGSIIKWAADMVKAAIQLGKDFIEGVIKFFKELPEKVLEFINKVIDSIKTWAANMVSAAKTMGKNFIDNVVTFFKELPGKILEFVTSAINNVTTWVTNMVAKAREMGTNFINTVVSFFTELPGKIKKFLDSAINNLTSWVASMGRKGKEAAKALIDNVVNGVKSVGSKLLEIGGNIVDGIWNGIVAAKDRFISSVQGFFSGIVDGVKGALGINSPSRVFRDEIGKWLPPGISEGFEAAMPAAMKDIQNELDDNLNKVKAKDLTLSPKNLVTGFKDNLKLAYGEVVTWFESVESRISKSVERMTNSILEFNKVGQTMINPDGTLGYVGYNGFTNHSFTEPYSVTEFKGDKEQRGDTFIFNSPKPIDEVEAARQMKKTKQEMAEGF